jgi:MFS family permease
MGPPKDLRNETEAERDDRNLIELLQELRVAGLGVQVLFGFLLSLPFTNQFKKLDGADRNLYLACLILAAVATALLLGPVAYHRLVFRQGMKEKLVQTANVMAILGLITVGLAVSCSLLLVASFVAGYGTGGVIAGLALLMFALLWFALPLARR